MKYDKFLLTLTFCISISSNISFAQQTTGWGSPATAVYNVMKSHGAKIFNAGTGFMTNISTPIFNIMSSWNTDKIFSVVKVGLVILIGIFGIIKVIDWLKSLSIKIPLNKQIIFEFGCSTLNDAFPGSIDALQKLAIDLPTENATMLEELLIQKYENDYLQYINNPTGNSFDTISNIIKKLINEVSDQNYIFENNDALIKHNIIPQNVSNEAARIEEQYRPSFYINKSLNDIPGLNWGINGLRYTALINLQTFASSSTPFKGITHGTQ